MKKDNFRSYPVLGAFPPKPGVTEAVYHMSSVRLLDQPDPVTFLFSGFYLRVVELINKILIQGLAFFTRLV